MNKKVFQTAEAPAAIGPYSQAIESNGFLFVSGQIPIDPKTQTVLAEASLEDQAHRVLKNLEALLSARKLSLQHVVKTTLFLASMADFPKVNEIYSTYFSSVAPARSTVEVSKLPKGVRLEIEAIATLS